MAISDIAGRTPGKARKGPRCETCALLARLPEDESAALRELLADETWRYSEISNRLREDEGILIAKENLGRHARGDCAARERLR